jgi:hypothetical protein
MPLENPIRFYARRLWEFVSSHARAARYYLWLRRLRREIEREPEADSYTDAAIAVPADHAANGNAREVAIPGFDPVAARDPAWRRAYKENRARRNEQALAVLNRKTRPATAYDGR